MLDICILGTGGGMPIPNRYLASALIRYQGRKILVDCGEGTQVSMKMLGWGLKTIDTICITHEHGDHTVGLPGLLATIGNSGRTDPITIIGPEGITEIVNGLRVVAPNLPYEVNIIENPQGPIKVLDSKGIIEVSTIELDHSTPCIGYNFYIKRSPKFQKEKAFKNDVPKILWNKLQDGNEVEYEGKIYNPNMVLGEEREGIKISYITDTRPIENIVDFIKDSDLFICEGNYGDDADIEKAIKNKHMTFSESAKLAKSANVKELVLTHFSPAMGCPEDYIDNAIKIFKNSKVSYDRDIYNINFKDKKVTIISDQLGI